MRVLKFQIEKIFAQSAVFAFSPSHFLKFVKFRKFSEIFAVFLLILNAHVKNLSSRRRVRYVRQKIVFGACSACSARVRRVFGTCSARVRRVFGASSARVRVRRGFGARSARVRRVFGTTSAKNRRT